uniref:Carbohydrate (N-acetylgalactosamine 4-sulfate 6-O) sulfotransferase 15 n=1 Tax=Eptatretus burgeri TaxID=7764 RepID=A0A8C4N7L5_EPTBU
MQTRNNFATVPRKFSVEYKNPCWFVQYSLADNPYKNNFYKKYSLMFKMNFKKMNHSFYNHILQKRGDMLRLRCVPYFYIIGQPKCGTTDIYRRLMMHPDIRFGVMKEPHWWARKRFGEQDNYTNNEYSGRRWASADLSLTVHHTNPGLACSPDKAQIEVLSPPGGSTNVSRRWCQQGPSEVPASPLLPSRLEARLHNSILSAPPCRLYSDYLYFGQHNKSVEDFHKKTEESINMFLNCTSEYSLRVCVYDFKLSIDMSVRLRIGLYVVFLLDWLSTFPQDQLLVLCLEDFSKNPVVFIRKIINFLQLGPVDEMTEYAMVSARPANSRKPHAKTLGDMLPETFKMLTEFYTPFNQKLAQLFNHDSFNWL